MEIFEQSNSFKGLDGKIVEVSLATRPTERSVSKILFQDVIFDFSGMRDIVCTADMLAVK
jgi:hypothetical protein